MKRDLLAYRCLLVRRWHLCEADNNRHDCIKLLYRQVDPVRLCDLCNPNSAASLMGKCQDLLKFTEVF